MPRVPDQPNATLLARAYRKAMSVVRRAGRLTPLRQLRAMQFRRLEPLAGGAQRGEPIVRHYWREFLEAHRADIRGRALEIGGTATLRRYGGTAVTDAAAIDLTERPGVTVVADLARADHLPADHYDCFVVPFTAHMIYDLDSALHHAVRILKPGGTLLINFPCVDYDYADGLDMGTGRPQFVFWSFTQLQVHNLLRRAGLGDDDYAMTAFGNLFARVAYQLNLPAEELTRREIDHVDRGHPLLVCVRAIKPREWQGRRPEAREAWLPKAPPARWNPRTGHYPEK